MKPSKARPKTRARRTKDARFDANATADRVRRILGRRDVTEKRMMGGLVFLVAGAMCCSVGRDGLLVRVAEGERERVLAGRHVAAMRLGGRTMTGFVRVEPAGLRTDAALAAWVKRGLAAAAAAPSRDAKRHKGRAAARPASVTGGPRPGRRRE